MTEEMNRIRFFLTGSSGFIGSQAVEYFDREGVDVVGVENNMRADFFGPDGDTAWTLRHLQGSCTRFTHHEVDIRDRGAELKPISDV